MRGKVKTPSISPPTFFHKIDFPLPLKQHSLVSRVPLTLLLLSLIVVCLCAVDRVPQRRHADQQLVHEVDEARAVQLGRDHSGVTPAAQQPGALHQGLNALVPGERADVVNDAEDLNSKW